jgi:hypothetical protein
MCQWPTAFEREQSALTENAQEDDANHHLPRKQKKHTASG